MVEREMWRRRQMSCLLLDVTPSYHLFTPVLIKSTEMGIFFPLPCHLFPSSFPLTVSHQCCTRVQVDLMPTSTHLPTLLPAANESEPRCHEDVANHYELLMRSIREWPWLRPAAISPCSLYLLQPVNIQTLRQFCYICTQAID